MEIFNYLVKFVQRYIELLKMSFGHTYRELRQMICCFVDSTIDKCYSRPSRLIFAAFISCK